MTERKHPYKLIVYRDRSKLLKKYRWKVVAGNGRTVGSSEQGYARKTYALFKGQQAYPDAVVIDETTA